MTTSTVTSIEKYVMHKGSAAGRNRRLSKVAGKKVRPLDDSRSNADMQSAVVGKDRYEQRLGRLDEIESRLARQNQLAVNIRDRDRNMQQVERHIEDMQNALNSVIDRDPPCPAGSDERIVQIRKADTLRKQIEALTALSRKGDNGIARIEPDGSSDIALDAESRTTVDVGAEPVGPVFDGFTDDYDSTKHRIPQLSDHAEDNDIRASIVQLREARTVIHRKRQALRTEASCMWRENGFLDDNQVAEQKSLFIGKHLSRHQGGDITGTPSLLAGFVN